MAIHSFKDRTPEIRESVYIAESAEIIGRVVLGNHSSVFFNAVLRADINDVIIGSSTNVQDNCTFHVSDLYPVRVGDGVTIGHNAILHACTVGDNCTIGMGAIVMDGSQIGENSIVGAGSVVPPGKKFESGQLILGSPARAIRPLTAQEIQANQEMAQKYLRVKNEYLEQES